MTPALSIYFDLVRFGAALTVVLHHLWPLVFPGFPLPWPGHEAVVVFFVLSGVVISHATSRPDQTLQIYAVHRAARILSVSLPAIALCICIAPFVYTEALENGGELSKSWPDFFTRVFANLFFIAESGWLQLKLPFNAPYWSINYEVTYYLIFGLWFFTKSKFRIYILSICILLVGVKILVLFPVWLLGVAIHRWEVKLSQRAAVVLFFVSLGLGLTFYFFEISKQIRTVATLQWPYFWSILSNANQFIGDWILGFIVAANFVAVMSLERIASILKPAEKLIRLIASYTLSIYLYHMPLAALIWIGLGIKSPIIFMILLVAGIGLLGHYTERQVKNVRSLISHLLTNSRKP